jgi:hypothetical protein
MACQPIKKSRKRIFRPEEAVNIALSKLRIECALVNETKLAFLLIYTKVADWNPCLTKVLDGFLLRRLP